MPIFSKNLSYLFLSKKVCYNLNTKVVDKVDIIRLKNVKKQYTIYGESKDHIAYVEFDIMTVGGKQYLGKDEEW